MAHLRCGSATACRWRSRRTSSGSSRRRSAAITLVAAADGSRAVQDAAARPDRVVLSGGALAARRPPVPGVRARGRQASDRVYLQSVDGGDPQPVTAEGAYGRLAVIADGEQFVTRGQDRRLAVFSIAGGEPKPLAGAEATDRPIVASADGEWLYVQGSGDMPGEIARIHLRSGKREPVRSLLPADSAGAMDILRTVMTPDARTYAYTFVRALSSLYLVEGLR